MPCHVPKKQGLPPGARADSFHFSREVRKGSKMGYSAGLSERQQTEAVFPPSWGTAISISIVFFDAVISA